MAVVTIAVARVKSRLFVAQLCLCLALCLLGPTPTRADSGNDRYSFSPASSRQRGLVMKGNGQRKKLSLPSRELGQADTILLGVRVAAAGASPRIRARVGALAIEQYFDPGAHGLRWLNLTSLRPALSKAATLELEALELSFTSQHANLRLFDNQIPFARGTLVIAPHPDDAEIAAFGLYASHAEHTHIVTVTSGNAGAPIYAAQFGSQVAAQYQFKGVLRVIDSVTVPWQGGVPPGRCYNLGYFDARLATMHAQKSEPIPELYSDNRDVAVYRRANLAALLSAQPRVNSWQNLVADLASLMADLQPAVVVLPHPLLDTHSDHQLVAVAVLEALAQHTKPVTFLLYTNHAGNNLYPYGPAGSVVSLPPWTASDLPVQSLYALPVDPALQRRKLFALESMHDLRLSPAEQKECGTQPPSVDSARNESTDYLRRAPRSEELFFVHDRASLTAVVERFLSSLTP